MTTVLATRRTYLQALGVGSLVTVFGGVSTSVARAAESKEEEIPLAKVPAAVRKAADKAVAGAAWTIAYLVHQDDSKVYELEGKDAKKRTVIVTIKPNGEIEDVTIEIKVSEVPKTVIAALEAKFPHFKAKHAFEILEEGQVTGYDLEGRRPDDKHDIGVYVSADTKTVELDEDE